jgi:hypothetical protein
VAVRSYTHHHGARKRGGGWLPYVGLGVVFLLVVVLAAGRLRGADAPATQSAKPAVAGADGSTLERDVAARAGELLVRWSQTGSLQEDDAYSQVADFVTDEFWPKAQEELDRRFSLGEVEPYAEAREAGVPYIARTIPLAYDVKHVDDRSAKVLVWYETIAGIGNRVQITRVEFHRALVSLKYEDGTWLYDGDKDLSPMIPWVAQDQRPSEPERLIREVGRYEPFTQVKADDAP